MISGTCGQEVGVQNDASEMCRGLGLLAWRKPGAQHHPRLREMTKG